MLCLFLKHQPDADSIRNPRRLGSIDRNRTGRSRAGVEHVGAEQVAEHRVGVGLALEQPAERHHQVRVVDSSISMIYSVFQQRNDIRFYRLLKFRIEINPESPRLRQSSPILRCRKIP